MGEHVAARSWRPIKRWGWHFVIANLVVVAMMVGSAWTGVDRLAHQQRCDGIEMTSGDRCKQIGRNSESFVPQTKTVDADGLLIGRSRDAQVSHNQGFGTLFLGIAVLIFAFYVFVVVRNWPRRRRAAGQSR